MLALMLVYGTRALLVGVLTQTRNRFWFLYRSLHSFWTQCGSSLANVGNEQDN